MEDKEKATKWPLVGNSHIIDFLSKSIRKDKVSGAYIFSGPEDLGKTTVAFHFVKNLLCQHKDKDGSFCGNCSSCRQFTSDKIKEEGAQDELNIAHSDFHLIKTEKDHRPGGTSKKNISIGQVREFISTLGMTSFLNSYKVGIIKNAEFLSNEAANALLKTLEEPRSKVVIILIANDAEMLPSTIVSRSQVLKFSLVNIDIIYNYLIEQKGASRSMAKNLSRLCLGRPALAVKFLEDKEFFEDYKEKINLSFGLFKDDINKRLEAVDKLLGGGERQEPAKSAYKIIDIWQGLIRDVLLLQLGHNNLIQFEIANEELLKVKNKLTSRKIIELSGYLNSAREYVRANVNPKLALENVIINM